MYDTDSRVDYSIWIDVGLSDMRNTQPRNWGLWLRQLRVWKLAFNRVELSTLLYNAMTPKNAVRVSISLKNQRDYFLLGWLWLTKIFENFMELQAGAKKYPSCINHR